MSFIKYTVLVLLIACLFVAAFADGQEDDVARNDKTKPMKPVKEEKTAKPTKDEKTAKPTKDEKTAKPSKDEKPVKSSKKESSDDDNTKTKKPKQSSKQEDVEVTTSMGSTSMDASMSGSNMPSSNMGSQSSGLPSFSFSGFSAFPSLASSPSAAPTKPSKPYSESQPRVRFFVGLVPNFVDAPTNTMTIKVNGKIPGEFSPLTRYVPTSYTTLDKSDSSYRFELFTGDTLLISEDFELTEGTDYTIAAIVNTYGKAYMVAYVDNNIAPATGMAKVRVVNAIAGLLAPSVNVISGFTPIFINVVTRDATNYMTVPAGSLLTVTLSNGLPIVISNRMIADAGNIYTIFVTGSPTGLFGSVNAISANMVLDSKGEMMPTNDIPMDKAMIRFAHFVNGGGAAEFIIPGLLPQTLNFGQVSSYFTVMAADLVYTVRYVTSFIPLKSGAVSLTGGKYYTLVLRQSIPDPLSGFVDITGTLIVDENQLPPQGHSAVRFVNYIRGGTDSFDISVGDEPFQRRIPYDGYSQYIMFRVNRHSSVPAQDLVIYSHTFPDTVYETISGFEDTLNEQAVYTMWVAGGPDASQVVTFLTVDFGNGTDPAQVASDAFDMMVMNKIKDNFAGISIALTDNNDVRTPIVWAKAYGYRSIINRWRLAPNSRMTVPGISSLIVYTLGVKAMDEGVLDLDSTLADTLKVKLSNPSLKDNKMQKMKDMMKKKKDTKFDITLRDLFTHTTGFRDNYNVYKQLAVFKDDSNVDLCDFSMEYISKNGKHFDKANFANAIPGNDFNYNNIDATVLACILEKKYNMDFMDLAMEKIFMMTVPNPMSNTYYSYNSWNPRVESQMFTPRVNGGFDQISAYTYPVWPAYNLRSTPTDLAMFLDNVVGQNGARILSPAAVEAMLTPFTDIDTGLTNLQIAHGWMVMTGVSANPLYGHPVIADFPGNSRPTGAAGHAWYDQVKGEGVVILANTADVNNVLPEILLDTFGAFSSLKNSYARPPECQKIGNAYDCERSEFCRWIKTNVCVKSEPDLP